MVAGLKVTSVGPSSGPPACDGRTSLGYSCLRIDPKSRLALKVTVGLEEFTAEPFVDLKPVVLLRANKGLAVLLRDVGDLQGPSGGCVFLEVAPFLQRSPRGAYTSINCQ